MRLALHVCAPDCPTAKHTLTSQSFPISIGRSSECTVQLPFKGVSRRHCLIAGEAGDLYVQDLDSTTGTFLNGQTVGFAPLRDGDELRMGVAAIQVRVVGEHGAPKSDDDEETLPPATTLGLPSEIPCELCGVPSRVHEMLSKGLFLADERAFCAGCVAQLPGLPSHGAFRFLRLLGAGGYGRVYKTLDTESRRIRAVKAVPLTKLPDEEMRIRLIREIGIGRSVDHPNIVKLHDAKTDGRTFYLTMDYIDGVDLKSYVEKQGPAPLEAAAQVAVDVGGALDYAHERRIVHRDVKPANVILARDGVTRLTDFGIARALDDSGGLTASGDGLGTPQFMAPEQFDDAKGAEEAADVYGLAATIYFMVTGSPPFERTGSLHDLFRAIRTTRPPYPATLRPDLPARSADALAIGMHPDPLRRYRRASELAREFAGSVRS